MVGLKPIKPLDLASTLDATAARDYLAEQGGVRDTPGNWPMESEALGVHPSQIADATEHARSIGIPTEFTPDGLAILRDREHRRRYCEAVGVFDRNAGYGDPTPRRTDERM